LTTWIVVEDEPHLYEVLLSMFEIWGINGLAFVDGESAVKWIDDVDAGLVTGDLPELALLDIRMPGRIQGNDIGVRLRESPRLRNITICYITAYRLSPSVKREIMEKSDADGYLDKPLPQLATLQKILLELIAQRKAKTQAAEQLLAPEPSPAPAEKPAPKRSRSKKLGPASRKPARKPILLPEQAVTSADALADGQDTTTSQSAAIRDARLSDETSPTAPGTPLD
jgi:CheY-like chemotaxis protein